MSLTSGILKAVQVRSLHPLALLISSWVNLLLHTCEVLLCVYFLFFSTQKITKGTVFFIFVALLVDTIGTVAVCCSTVVALDSLTSTGSIDQAGLTSHWSTLSTVFTTYLASVLEQSFFLRRYWSISHNRIITSILAILIFLNAASAIAIATFFQVNPVSIGTLELKENTPLFVMMVSSAITPGHCIHFPRTSASAAIMAATDISLAMVTIWKLKSVKTSRNATRALLHKVCFYIGAYGCVTAVSTSLLLAFWLTDLNGYTFVFRILGRIYSLTALVNFLLVYEWRAEAAKKLGAFHSPYSHTRSAIPSRLTALPVTDPTTQGLTMPQKCSVPAPMPQYEN
ncbi:hypothetical protein GGU10DRAFT_109905 [Lentinula aff. detonsa]|uniref:Transmembrane protein n=1 Tax=Lentinula aff. detonsa TaxID=2804958 RepID=A0AA38KU19_9AGAR|nr:hypothetical protein GGU10DRAFT_109905 [Lentinula aff. detonsa]